MRGGCPEFPDNHSTRRNCRKNTTRDGQILQPGCDHFGRLPGQIASGHSVPHLGHPAAEGIHRQRFCPERRAFQVRQLHELFHGVAGTHPRNPAFRAVLLPEDQGHLRHQHRLRSQDEKTIEFFKMVQNKLLWAISQQTAAELVYRRADAALPLMGMQSFDKKGLAVRKVRCAASPKTI